MLRVSLVLRLICAALLMAATVAFVPFHAQAAKKTKFAKGPISVRLCPARCLEVKRHSYKSGGVATVYETRGGWARVSEHIDPARLKAFGGNIPAKPAFWVRTRQLANPVISVATPAADEKPAETAKKPAAKKKSKPRRFVQRRRVTLPRFRPDVPVQMAVLTETEKPEVTPSEPITMEPEKPAMQVPEVVEAKSDGEKTEQRLVPEAPKTAVKPVVETPVMKKDDAEKVAVADKQPEAKTASEGKVIYSAPKAEQPELRLQAEDVKSEKPAAKGAQTLTEADKFVAPAPKATEKTEEKPQEQVKDPAVSKPAESVTAVKDAETPVKDPAKPTDEVKVAALEPQPENTDVVPLAIEERPKTYTRALRDKRLRKLPGSKDKRFKLPEVIALRHHALMLLKNEECGGIVGGGRSAGQPGMLFVVCQEDPTYMHQFPLEEQTW